MPNFDPFELLPGTVLIVAPHMDDEALACGGLIAKLPRKERIHIVYATDGMKSPAPIIAGRDAISPDLGEVRVQEAVTAMNLLGVPAENLHFLCLPEAQLQKHTGRLLELLKEKVLQTAPDHVFVPFRFDRHPDHLAVHSVMASLFEQGLLAARPIEYFVYYRWRLMPKGDIRKYIQPDMLYRLDIADAASQKREALDCYTSQTTIYYPWQTRPILTPMLLDEECQNPEFFLMPGATRSAARVFTGAVGWIRVAHRLEPFLQRWKYYIGATIKRGIRNSGR
jgi:LmbE family N-acetylglucosaminyl deacetylase